MQSIEQLSLRVRLGTLLSQKLVDELSCERCGAMATVLYSSFMSDGSAKILHMNPTKCESPWVMINANVYMDAVVGTQNA